MPLKSKSSGEYIIKTKKDAQQAIQMAQEIKEAIADDVKDAGNLMRSAAHFVRDNMEDGQIKVGNKQFNLIRPSKRLWVVYDEDMPENAPDDAEALENLVDKKTLAKLTRRVADPEKIEIAVGTGLVDEDEIAPALIEIQDPKSVYLR